MALVYLKVIHSSVVAFTCDMSRLAALETTTFGEQAPAFLWRQRRDPVAIIGRAAVIVSVVSITRVKTTGKSVDSDNKVIEIHCHWISVGRDEQVGVRCMVRFVSAGGRVRRAGIWLEVEDGVKTLRSAAYLTDIDFSGAVDLKVQ